jgi:uncharacterized protein YciI
MLFIAACVDKPHSLETRLANRAAHLDYLKTLGAKVKTGGPMLADDLQTPAGSMLILEGESAAEIEAILAEDPYRRAGLFESVTVTPWRQAVGQSFS